ncbi:HAS-barrel domain-containing protein [Candidatus Cyanaurora vandensis]|uniref:HAS-barrel domain-containing protein n=1 Tax=Candidatus Cyanaurora vandensis TaxID=2714958 RepID=UPI0025802B6F|nr:hypothetical protein [Candidatus Cyanaurora vandensis]
MKKLPVLDSPRSEVIEAATTEFLAQCLDSERLEFTRPPAFGSLVKAVDEERGLETYGVVYYATTAPVDSVHRARALGRSLQQLRDEQPQIFEMLKTEFRCVIVGYRSEGRNYQHLPPYPPQVHEPVRLCTTLEVARFYQNLNFLRTLLGISGAPVDELIAATLRQGYLAHDEAREWLVRAGRELSLLLKDDYDRLSTIVKRLQP